MEMSSELLSFLKELQLGTVHPRPPDEDWKTHVDRISVEGQIAEVAEDDWDYWLDILPPKLMLIQHAKSFCFAEGEEALRLFWFDRATKRYLAKKLTWDESVKLWKLSGADMPWWY